MTDQQRIRNISDRVNRALGLVHEAIDLQERLNQDSEFVLHLGEDLEYSRRQLQLASERLPPYKEVKDPRPYGEDPGDDW